MSRTVTEFEVHDIRFPTSQRLDGSDAMNPDPDYSEVAAAVAYLASPAAAAVTGTALAVDGGMQGVRLRAPR